MSPKIPKAKNLQRRCCSNPFKKTNHKKYGQSIRKFNNEFVCNACRMELYNKPNAADLSKDSKKSNDSLNNSAENEVEMKIAEFESEDSNTKACNSFSDPEDDDYNDKISESEMISGTLIDNFNKCIEILGITPITSVDRKSKKSKLAKFRKIQDAFNSIAEQVLDIQIEKNDDFDILVNEIREKITQTDKTSEKIKFLTMAPITWSVSELQSHFSVSKHMAMKAKSLHQEQGIGSTPNPKPGNKLNSETDKLVKEFYYNDDFSRVQPGKRDCKSVKKVDGRVHVQKRLLLGNAKELLLAFKKAHPDHKIGLSKFWELKPKECIPVGGKGTHSVCVCKIHQNFKLMISGAQLKKLTIDDESKFFLQDYKTILQKIMCGNPTVSCHSLECDNCPGVDSIKSLLKEIFDENFIDNITYKKWTTTDRSNLETHVDPVDEFIDKFCEDLCKLIPHDFIAKSQSKFLEDTKNNLMPGEFLVLGDFAENYTCLIQDAIQSYHWNNTQVTIHPFVVYYKKNDELLHESYVVVSECLTHDAVTVNLFVKKFIEQLKKKHDNVKKTIFFTDGAASQYKNKTNFINLTHHFQDFKVKAEWHFFATSHGKSPCDGVGGTIKRCATLASLKRPLENQLTTPLDVYEWAKDTMPRITFIYSTNEEYENHTKFLKRRSDQAKQLPGSRSFHSFIPLDKKKISCRMVSKSTFSKVFVIVKKKKLKSVKTKTKTVNSKTKKVPKKVKKT